MLQKVVDGQYGKVPVAGLYRICKDIFVIGWRPEPISIGKTEFFGRQLNGQRSAAFCSTRIKYFTAAYGCHSGAETVSSDAF